MTESFKLKMDSSATSFIPGRLVDTEEFKHKINHSSLYGTHEWNKVLDMLDECETKEYTPPSAKWVQHPHEESMAQCSHCKIAWDKGDVQWCHMNFCPSCGYQMEIDETLERTFEKE